MMAARTRKTDTGRPTHSPAAMGTAASPLALAGRPYTSTAKRYTCTYPGMRMEPGHWKLDVCRAALDFAVYGYENGNGNDGHPPHRWR